MTTYTTHHKIPAEMLDDEPALNSMARGNPYQTSTNMLQPSSPWAHMRVEWPDRETAAAALGEEGLS